MTNVSRNDKLFLVIFFSCLLGIFVRSFFEIPLWVFVSLVIWVAIIFLLVRSKEFLLLGIIGISMFSLGVARFEVAELVRNDTLLDMYLGEKVVLSGIVYDEVDVRVSQQRLFIELQSLEGTDFRSMGKTKILVSTDLYPRHEYGDLVEVEGTLERPSNFETAGNREFDYINYLGKDGIFYTISFAHVSLIDTDYGNSIKKTLLKFKQSFINSINRAIPEPESALLNGVLLGSKQSLSRPLQQAFIDTGTIHIVVLSGYNITIVAEAIVRVFQQFFSKTIGLALGGFGIIAFALLAGGGATVVRASLMALIALLARVTGRTYEITRALIVAALIMVLHNPYILVFDISFQLSFLATLGLIYIAPCIENYLARVPKFFGLREILASTIATQIAVLPYLLYRIGTLSVIAPLANVLVLPLVPSAMLFGFLTSITHMVSGVVSVPFAWLSYGILHLQIRIVEILSSFGWSAITVSSFSPVFMVLGYVLIIWFFFIRKSSVPRSQSVLA